jgi:hypothetical protein
MYAVSSAALHDLAILKRSLPEIYWGIAPHVEDLGGRWAASLTYGTSVCDYMRRIEKWAVPPPAPETPSPWALAEVEQMKELGVMRGDADGWHPRRPVTREELAVTISRLLGYLLSR